MSEENTQQIRQIKTANTPAAINVICFKIPRALIGNCSKPFNMFMRLPENYLYVI